MEGIDVTQASIRPAAVDFRQINVASSVEGSASTTEPDRTIAMPDSKKVELAVASVNKKLNDTSTHVVFDFDSKSNRFWLNMVEKDTGKVITEFPPEAVRTIVDSYSLVGLSIDKFR